jgi:NAD(P)-dependent dehydrogenase (short-subunit alcohol dehydrogenase family)
MAARSNFDRARREGLLSWNLEGGVAVITGAGSGIGRSLAKRLASEKMSLALADNDAAGLEETGFQLCACGQTVSTHAVDVSDLKRVEQFATEVIAKHGRVTLLINNAGVAMWGTVEELSIDEIAWLMGINYWGVVYGVKTFLPLLRREPRAHIVNVSSIYGMISPAGQSAYCSAKFAVRGFTEVLLHELAGSTIGVSCVHPGGIRTAVARRARIAAKADPAKAALNIGRFDRIAMTLPEAAADRIVDGVKRGESRILVGKDAVRLDRLQRIFPIRYWNSLVKRGRKLEEWEAKNKRV